MRRCPYCGADRDEPCRSPTNGRFRREPHAARLRLEAPTPIAARQRTISARRRFSQDVKARAKGICEPATPECPAGRHYGQHAHHIVSRGRGGANVVENGLWVCWRAHDWIHSHPAEATALGLLGTGS